MIVEYLLNFYSNEGQLGNQNQRNCPPLPLSLLPLHPVKKVSKVSRNNEDGFGPCSTPLVRTVMLSLPVLKHFKNLFSFLNLNITYDAFFPRNNNNNSVTFV